MKSFKEFGITPTSNAFIGEKIKIGKVINKQIQVHAYEIKPSKHNDGDCLKLQIELEGVKRIIFTGSTVLRDMIMKVPKDGFPFTTTIIQEDERYEFN